ncbi:MAG TPA: DUF2889 domain-containing protein [Acidimicrobiia bacterium]|nr:DUF2889 domain-containing protein [Acidimicrobiia bacterium]
MTTRAAPAGGPQNPRSGTPARRAGSVRRTTTHDSLRPDGIRGDIRLVATGRDLRTEADGSATVLDAARVELRVAYQHGRRIAALECDPARPELAALVGGGTAVGYRAAVDAALPGERERGGVLYQLLDDVPNALLVNGYAMALALDPEERRAVRQASASTKQARPDLCAGWVTGGTIMRVTEAEGLPPLAHGPVAPSLVAPDDGLAWHPAGGLPPTAMRRSRRIDVWPEERVIAVEAFFRDSHVDGDGVESIVHEYTVRATVDPATLCFTSIGADAGVLPFGECPNALGSEHRLTGRPLSDLRSVVSREFTGPTTCTHLNDTLRSFEDLPALIAAL